jgi:hypothetical protein
MPIISNNNNFLIILCVHGLPAIPCQAGDSTLNAPFYLCYPRKALHSYGGCDHRRHPLSAMLNLHVPHSEGGYGEKNFWSMGATPKATMSWYSLCTSLPVRFSYTIVRCTYFSTCTYVNGVCSSYPIVWHTCTFLLVPTCFLYVLCSLYASDGYRLLPLALDIGFFARYADALAIGSCSPLPSAFVDGT